MKYILYIGLRNFNVLKLIWIYKRTAVKNEAIDMVVLLGIEFCALHLSSRTN